MIQNRRRLNEIERQVSGQFKSNYGYVLGLISHGQLLKIVVDWRTDPAPLHRRRNDSAGGLAHLPAALGGRRCRGCAAYAHALFQTKGGGPPRRGLGGLARLALPQASCWRPGQAADTRYRIRGQYFENLIISRRQEARAWVSPSLVLRQNYIEGEKS